MPDTGLPRRPGFQRSVSNAVVLMVLALGKICLMKDRKIPHVVQVNDPNHPSPVVRNGHPASPSQSSPFLRISLALVRPPVSQG